MLTRHLLTADVVYNGMGTPRSHGAVVLQNQHPTPYGPETQIIAVMSQKEARQNYEVASEHAKGFAISSPPVNAHCHLDLTWMPLTHSTYSQFIRAVIAHDKSQKAHALDAAKAGLTELRGSGVRAIGDIVRSEAVMHYLLQEPYLQGVAYWEVIDPNPATADKTLHETVEKIRAFKRLERPNHMRVGLSPHTPHTVSAPLLQGLARFARQENLPMQIHVAESPSEMQLHGTNSGELADLMRPFAPDFTPSGLTPIGYLASLGILEYQPALVHGVHVTEEDVRLIARANCCVIHCPRSNHTLRCGRFLWELYMKHGVEVALGTDSRGSSPNLNIKDELYAARDLHSNKASDLALVRAAVKGGYRSLQLQTPRWKRGDSAKALYIW